LRALLKLPDDDPELAYFGRIYFAEIVSNSNQIISGKGLAGAAVLIRNDFGVRNGIRSNKQAVHERLFIGYAETG
jgi:hypothetical protein